jgi:hypothetical protein
MGARYPRAEQGMFHLCGQGPIFRTFFSAENHFPWKILWNFLEKQFFKTFSAENSIFSQHFLGKIFRGFFPKIFTGKMYEKSAPAVFF